MRISKLHIKLVLIPTIMLFCFQSVFAGYGVSFTRESIKKNRSVVNNRLHSSQSLSEIYCQVLFKTDKENGLNAIAKPANKKYKRKNPTLAFGLAFVPGFFIHGLGHYYLGDNDTAAMLTAAELFSLLTLYISMGLGIGSTTNGNNGSTGFYKVIAAFSTAIFFGSWIYDFIGAPIKAIKMNQKHESAFYIYPEIKADKVTLNFACSFDEL